MLEELKKMGADITPIDNNRFVVVDNGFFGFLEQQDPFIIDKDELVEIYNQYK